MTTIPLPDSAYGFRVAVATFEASFMGNRRAWDAMPYRRVRLASALDADVKEQLDRNEVHGLFRWQAGVLARAACALAEEIGYESDWPTFQGLRSAVGLHDARAAVLDRGTVPEVELVVPTRHASRWVARAREVLEHVITEDREPFPTTPNHRAVTLTDPADQREATR